MFFAYDHASVRFTGRWAPLTGGMATTAAGSKLEFAFKGTLAVMHFDIHNIPSAMPHLWISVDGGDMAEATVDHYLRVHCNADGEHRVTVIYKGGQETMNRWYHPLGGKVHFLGFDADDCAALPPQTKKTIELIGDSITEGVLIDAQYAPIPADQENRPYEDDFLATYGCLTATALGLEPLPCAYGAVGVTRTGCGAVPPAPDMYSFCFDGAPVTYPAADFVLINHGTNDRGASADTFAAAYRRLLDAVVAKNPQAKIAVITPFCGAFHDELFALVADYNKAHGTDIFVVDTAGWLPLDPLHPLRAGHRKAADRLIPILREHFGL